MVRRVSTRNALFQQWEALLANRSKRHRSATFLIHGVRPITLAVQHGWPIDTVLFSAQRSLSAWAKQTLTAVDAEHVAVTDELLLELGGKDDAAPELVAVGRTRPDDLTRVKLGPAALVVVLDRPANPGNVGTLVRAADAFGADGVVLCGHGADIYDPRTVRASTGSLFIVPTVHVPAPHDVMAWVGRQPVRGIRVVGTDESGGGPVDEHDFRGPTVLVVGNETRGMSAAWRVACTDLVSIPIGGGASSLNAASAGAVVLYEIARQRGFPSHGDR